MIVCIQCAMRAMLDRRPYAGEPDDTPEAHMQRVHPDPEATRAERRELEQALSERIRRGDV